MPSGPSERWLTIGRDVVRGAGQHRLLAIAAGTVFYAMLALFPAITALVSSYALLAQGDTINDHLAALSGLLPADVFSLIQRQVQGVLANGEARLSVAFLFGLGLALWSAAGGMKAVIDSLNVVYGEDERRGFIKLNAVALGLTLALLALMLAAIGLVVAVPVILNLVGLGQFADLLLRYGRWPLLAALVVLGLAVLYRFGPDHRAPQWRWISPGSVAATLAWIAGSVLLSYYFANFANYDATYGSLGAAIALMMWLWMSAIVTLLGAELNAAIDKQSGAVAPQAGGAAEATVPPQRDGALIRRADRR